MLLSIVVVVRKDTTIESCSRFNMTKDSGIWINVVMISGNGLGNGNACIRKNWTWFGNDHDRFVNGGRCKLVAEMAMEGGNEWRFGNWQLIL